MDIEIGDHPALDELVSDEVAGERDPLLLGHLTRDRELDLTGKLRVFAHLNRLDVIPEFFAVAPFLGAPSGSITKLCTTPALFEKSWLRPSRSSCSRSAER